MIRIGLTGGIGAGKSTVARVLTERGAYLVDSDKIAREVVAPGTPGLERIVEAFGTGVLADDGSLDRPALAAIAFANEENRLTLNGITHPLIGARTTEMIGAAPADGIVLQDIPLLVEGGLAPLFHLVIIVHADVEERVRRLTGQRGMGEEDARARIAAQATEEQRRAVADVWIDNTGAPDDLEPVVGALWDDRLVPFEANIRSGTIAPAVAVDEPWGPDAQRLVARLWAVCGGLAATIECTSAADSSVRVVVPDADSAHKLAEPLREGGFPQAAAGSYGSADPFRPAAITMDVAAG
ncbi:dephospho-CoA kinase [Jongsikchunia kroppenstedtii]|uniref:dephospho-CoA kinase n=1 Tax=Jongsikchunia kroppenstedtii TaxID=1121721 RepID=UPI0005BD0749|nr:dephospho-CoA kinase [Jongsikchunia kroppenstedtii]